MPQVMTTEYQSAQVMVPKPDDIQVEMWTDEIPTTFLKVTGRKSDVIMGLSQIIRDCKTALATLDPLNQEDEIVRIT